MSYLDNYSQELGGFNFELTHRNKLMEQNKVYEKPSFKKTGTTIIGLKFRDGVILAADTRATGGSIVVEKNCEKIHYVAPNIYSCGAGTAADTQFVNLFMSSNLELQRLNSGRETRVAAYVALVTKLLHKYDGELGAHLIAGGYDALGAHLVMIGGYGKYIHFNLSYSYLPFAAMGSGSLNAISVLETRFADDLSREEAIDIAINAIAAGIYHDLGSGSNVDYYVITKNKVEKFRNAVLYKDLPPMNI